MELLGKEGVINLVSLGHEAKEEPTTSRSTNKKSSTPACASAIAAPIPAAPAPIMITSNVSELSSDTLFFPVASLGA